MVVFSEFFAMSKEKGSVESIGIHSKPFWCILAFPAVSVIFCTETQCVMITTWEHANLPLGVEDAP